MTTILTSERWAPILTHYLSGSIAATSRKHLRGGQCLIGFNTGIVVPAEVLRRYRRAYNFHAAPPEYPGRDPHHWAVYERAKGYGVTCHVMAAKIDEGPIIAVERFSISGLDVQIVRRYAEARLLGLFAVLAAKLANSVVSPIPEKWSGVKRARADLLQMLDFRGLDQQEKQRRLFAFEGFLPSREG